MSLLAGLKFVKKPPTGPENGDSGRGGSGAGGGDREQSERGDGGKHKEGDKGRRSKDKKKDKTRDKKKKVRGRERGWIRERGQSLASSGPGLKHPCRVPPPWVSSAIGGNTCWKLLLSDMNRDCCLFWFVVDSSCVHERWP